MADRNSPLPRIAFVGAGNMASSIIGGLLESGHPPDLLHAADPLPASLERLRELGPINLHDSNASAVEAADVIILAVKPQVMAEVCTQLATLPARADQLFISIAAGVPAAAIDRWLGGDRSIVRCMPNTPALLQLGAPQLDLIVVDGPGGDLAVDRLAQRFAPVRGTLGAIGLLLAQVIVERSLYHLLHQR